ncbi:MAG TPA: tautomerase family protein, partial [Rubellimicrobium sp.]|nr:tautomerase family protein [Rubellimicrobium sp.]
MPMIDIKLPKGAIDETTRATLADRLTGTLLKWEKAPDNDVTRAITWVYYDERELHVTGGPAAGKDHFVVLVTVPEGALSDRRKEGLVQEATEVFLEVTGMEAEGFEDRVRVWVHIHEVPDGHWGAAGQIFRYK